MNSYPGFLSKYFLRRFLRMIFTQLNFLINWIPAKPRARQLSIVVWSVTYADLASFCLISSTHLSETGLRRVVEDTAFYKLALEFLVISIEYFSRVSINGTLVVSKRKDLEGLYQCSAKYQGGAVLGYPVNVKFACKYLTIRFPEANCSYQPGRHDS